MEAARNTGFWELTVIMVAIASWLLYRYVAPRGWREWSRAGLVQAFIIALYAEMYGFPLTIYVWNCVDFVHPKPSFYEQKSGDSLFCHEEDGAKRKG